MAKQNAAYAALSERRTSLKTQYDALVAQDDETGLDEAGLEQLIEIEGQFWELDAEYQEAKIGVEERQRVANEKAYNKASSESSKADAAVAEIKGRLTAAQAQKTSLDKVYTDLNTVLTTLTGIYNREQNDNNLREMRRQEKKVSDAKKEVDAIDLVISGINTELTAAQTDAATKKATYDAA